MALFETEQGGRVQNRELTENNKQLATEKASLEDEVNRLQGSEMATRVASAESRAEGLTRKVDELKADLQKVQAEKDSGIQAAKDVAALMAERAKKAEAELSGLKQRLAEASQNFARAEDALNRTKESHERAVSIAWAQGAEWFVGSAAFQDAAAIACANLTTAIYNEIRGKVLRHRPYFPIGELAFFEGEDIDNEGKSLAEPADTTVRLRWDLNENWVPVWPPSILQDGEGAEGLPNFDAWVEGMPVAEAEPSSTPPSQPAAVEPEHEPARTNPDRSPPASPSSARQSPAPAAPADTPAAPADSSATVDLTDDVE
ncbi:hypothetical protein SLA2020_510750 [Shorea laevis]